MKLRRIFTTMFLCSVWGIGLSAQELNVLYLIDGRFYKQVPPSLSLPCIGSMSRMTDSAGGVFYELSLNADCEFDKADLALALPEEEVPLFKEKLQLAAKMKDRFVTERTVKYLIEGLFFSELPSSLDGRDIHMVRLSDKVSLIVFDGALSADDKSYAMPANEVPRAKELLAEAEKPRRMMRMRLHAPEPISLAEGDTLPDFSVTDTEGRVWNRNDLLGSPLVLNFWYTGCGSCIREMPELSGWTKLYPKTHFLAVTWNSREQIEPIVAKQQFLFRQIVSDKELWKMFSIQVTPTTVLVDKQGIIRKVVIGTNQQKRDALAELLKELQ